ncbi:ATP-binding protein [Enterococcus sp. AZ109]|uniref:ATP-binding protein n=1 Tax=Enterococcus sp. AZ109 TaxID=2774634 RepID=UPI003F29B901
MESIATALERIMDKVLIVTGECPKCGGPMRKWKNTNKDGSERCAPVCTAVDCGYRVMTKLHQTKERAMFDEAKMKDALSRLMNTSIVTDKSIFSNRFEDYRTPDSETKLAKKKALEWAADILEGKKVHAILTGSPGVGKTHLGMSVLDFAMKKSGYVVSCSVVSYRELLEQLKFAMNDSEARKQIQGALMTEIKKTDLVLIDDVGAELGRLEDNQKATPYDVDVITSLAEARLDKATIFTTNLTSKQLINAYGERVFSRMMNNAGNEYVMNFKETKDKRRHPL